MKKKRYFISFFFPIFEKNGGKKKCPCKEKLCFSFREKKEMRKKRNLKKET
jgi:hypothetical protein